MNVRAIVILCHMFVKNLLSLATTKPVHHTDMLYEMVEATRKIPKLVIVPKVRILQVHCHISAFCVSHITAMIPVSIHCHIKGVFWVL